eukprot:CAMPEP_0175055836 /NCGR_PEP_ID=MMETSP0052_2-20121109/10312_1 /TAXON_ID=51329 ORGANISM="Polytomella parva, Strain SAG 63-3" /NCGR_SAMPLE_ID=MMETSP0052_2 /ASSEMBLY_ACC=CAM_ASM_000194 /LENGTH=239 /DNA_ID=CAMNT_0016320747 /DNA_START=52 /DNA_END=771 /DNA_ORIENTATION=-
MDVEKKPFFILGLTGSIGSGKSTVSSLFLKLNIPVWDADATVHKLYSKGGKAVPLIEELFPSAVIDEEVHRPTLGRLVLGNEEAIKKLESLIHPLVSEDRLAFLKEHYGANNCHLVVLDIPLLYETKVETLMDAVLVVTASYDVVSRRVLQRPGMTAEKLSIIWARQMPSEEKCRRADFVIDTSLSDLEHTRQQIEGIVADIQSEIQSRLGRANELEEEASEPKNWRQRWGRAIERVNE